MSDSYACFAHEIQHSIGDSSGGGCDDGDASDFGGNARGHFVGDGVGEATVSYAVAVGDGHGKDHDGNVWGEGYGEGYGNGDVVSSGDNPIMDVVDGDLGFPEEVVEFCKPWTPEKILHAYAYMSATSQEERDSILGLLELTKNTDT